MTVSSAAATEQATQILDPAEPGVAVGDEALLVEELLVEEISIDGMCGVY